MLSRHHLQIIRAVHQHGSISQAAEALFLSQSALSHALKKLEHQLGLSIWQKEGRQLRLTQAGERLLHFAQWILPQFDYLEEELAHYARGQRGLLRLGMECHPCYQWLLKVVKPYLEQWRHVDVDVKQQFQFKGTEALRSYEVDVLITPDPTPHPGLLFIPVFPYEQVLLLSQQHPLAQQECVQAEDLQHETLITYPVPKERLDVFHFLWHHHLDVAQHKTLETTEMILQMVAANRGVSALPLWLVQQQAAHLPLKTLRLGQGIFKTIHLGIREKERDLDYLAGFIELAKKTRHAP